MRGRDMESDRSSKTRDGGSASGTVEAGPPDESDDARIIIALRLECLWRGRALEAGGVSVSLLRHVCVGDGPLSMDPLGPASRIIEWTLRLSRPQRR